MSLPAPRTSPRPATHCKSENKMRSTLSFLLALSIIGATLANCQSKPEPGSAQASQPTGNAASGDPREGTVAVAAGPFLFGATDKQIDFYVSQSVVNFPGMVEAIRSSFSVPQRSLVLEGFQIDQFEVTNRDYKRFLAETHYQPADRTDYLAIWQGDDYPDWAETFPVVWISQPDAMAFCKWRGGWLPTEEEWEKAARGTDGRYFPWGNVFPSPDVANFSSKQAEPAGNRPGDVSPVQAYDMGGNVAELTQSLAQLGGVSHVVVRGGSYANQAREMMTVHRDLSADSSTRRADLGFRCAVR